MSSAKRWCVDQKERKRKKSKANLEKVCQFSRAFDTFKLSSGEFSESFKEKRKKEMLSINLLLFLSKKPL